MPKFLDFYQNSRLLPNFLTCQEISSSRCRHAENKIAHRPLFKFSGIQWEAESGGKSLESLVSKGKNILIIFHGICNSAGWLGHMNTLGTPKILQAPLHLVARKCCICKEFSCKCKKIARFLAIFLPLKSRKCCIVKKMLHWQDFLANATFSCKCNIFLPLNVKVPRARPHLLLENS